ncbi:glycoside hydrolase [Infundibulicybe gibba]|nr:glycoside hydrolase [Infundibulicybe gibba]
MRTCQWLPAYKAALLELSAAAVGSAMVFFQSRSCLAALAVSCLLMRPVYSTAINTTNLDGLDQQARDILARATPAAPHFVVYGDAYDGTTGPPSVSQIKGFNVFALSFLLLEGAWDKAQEWTTLTAAQRSTIKSQYAAAGIKLIVSVFGSTDVPTSTNADPIATANTMAAWVKQYNLDGIDVDYEDFNAFDAGNGKAETWLINFTKQLRTQLPQGTYLLTHAPVAPWFSPNKWGGGGYLKVHSSVGSLIDWYNVQFYNQGSSEYTTCANLLTTSSNTWPESAVFQIAANGVPLNKIVIGKPATSSDAGSGFMSTSTLASCLQQAKAKGWTAGAMVWEYPRAAASWISSVRASSWPV